MYFKTGIVLLLSLLLFGQVSFGLGNNADDAGQRQVETQIKLAEAEVKRAKEIVAMETRSLEKAKKANKDCIERYKDDEGKIITNCTKGMASYQLDFQNKIHERLTKANQALAVAEQKLSESKNSQVQAEQRARIDTVDRAVQSTLIDSAKLNADIVEYSKEVDKTKMAKYLMLKMGLLLNSQSFCESKKRCELPRGSTKANGTDYAVDSKELARDIFSSETLEDSFLDLNYWELGQKRRNTEAPPSSTK